MHAFVTERIIAATPAQVFNAFENPALLAVWWGPSGFTNTFELFEFRDGGSWRFVMHGPDGTNYPNRNIFLKISEPKQLVIRHDCEPFFTLTVSLNDADGGTLLSWHQAFDDDEVASRVAAIVIPSNEQVLDRLQRVLAGQSPDC